MADNVWMGGLYQAVDLVRCDNDNVAVKFGV